MCLVKLSELAFRTGGDGLALARMLPSVIRQPATEAAPSAERLPCSGKSCRTSASPTTVSRSTRGAAPAMRSPTYAATPACQVKVSLGVGHGQCSYVSRFYATMVVAPPPLYFASAQRKQARLG